MVEKPISRSAAQIVTWSLDVLDKDGSIRVLTTN
jgi:hypothetical protein